MFSFFNVFVTVLNKFNLEADYCISGFVANVLALKTVIKTRNFKNV